MKKVLHLLLPLSLIVGSLFVAYAIFGIILCKHGDYETSAPMLIFAAIGFLLLIACVVVVILRHKMAPPVFVQFPHRKIDPCTLLPFEGNLPALYAASVMSDEYSLYQNAMGVYVLRWIRSGQVALRYPRKDATPNTPNSLAMRFFAPRSNLLGQELDLYTMLLSASGQDYRLHVEEFASWLAVNEKHLRRWHSQLFMTGLHALRQMDAVQLVPVHNRNGRWAKPGTNMALTLASTQIGVEEMKKVQGFVKYLDNCELMSRRHTFEVQIWEDYLAFAHFFNRGDRMELTFDSDYPVQFLYPGRFFRFGTYQRPYLYMDGSYSFVSPVRPAVWAKREFEVEREP